MTMRGVHISVRESLWRNNPPPHPEKSSVTPPGYQINRRILQECARQSPLQCRGLSRSSVPSLGQELPSQDSITCTIPADAGIRVHPSLCILSATYILSNMIITL